MSTKVNKHEIEAAYRNASARSFMVFIRGLTIPSAYGPKTFELVMADFQREFFEDIAPSLHALKDGNMPPKRRFWLERTKKTAKDADVAACLIWLMAFTSRPFLGQVCAANSEQAAIIEDRARAILYHNKWLHDYVDIVQRVIRSKQNPNTTKTQIEATGSAGAAQGPTPDILILNELVHVERWDVMKSHMNNAAGVPMGMMIVATNAGIKGTPAEVWRKNALSQTDRWRTHIYTKVAPWVSKEDMEDAKRLDPIGAEYARLWEGRWISGTGSAVNEDEIDRCFRLKGFLQAPESSWRYVAGLDLGISHDHAGLVVLGANEQENRIKEAAMRGYVPSVPNDKGILEVDADLVEADVIRYWQRFRIEWFGYDPAAGGSFMAQRLRRKGVPMREMTFASATNQTLMAVSFVTSIKSERLECYDDPEGRMRRDFGKFNIEHKPPSKYKLTAVSDEYGHADVGVALAICLPKAVAILDGSTRLLSTDVLVEEEDVVLSKDEIEAMPDELREIYELENSVPGYPKNRPLISEMDPGNW